MLPWEKSPHLCLTLRHRLVCVPTGPEAPLPLSPAITSWPPLWAWLTAPFDITISRSPWLDEQKRVWNGGSGSGMRDLVLRFITHTTCHFTFLILKFLTCKIDIIRPVRPTPKGACRAQWDSGRQCALETKGLHRKTLICQGTASTTNKLHSSYLVQEKGKASLECSRTCDGIRPVVQQPETSWGFPKQKGSDTWEMTGPWFWNPRMWAPWDPA